MSTATATQTRQTHGKPQEAEADTLLDQTIAATTTRTQSIRNDAAKFLGVPPDKVCALLRNVWKPSKGQPEFTDAEMFMGMSLIARYGLDPIAREVYVGRDNKGRLMTIIGIDGFIKIMHNADGYDGFEQELGWNKDGTELDWVETKIYSTKVGRPTTYRAFAKEYAKLAGFMYDAIPWHMLRIFSLHHAVRMFTPIGGQAVTPDEARWMQHYEPASPQARAAESLESELAARREAKAAKELEPANTPEIPESSPAPESTQQQATDLFGGQAEPEPGPGPDAMYLDAIDSADAVQLPNILQQARQVASGGVLTAKQLTDIEAAGKRRAKELKK